VGDGETWTRGSVWAQEESRLRGSRWGPACSSSGDDGSTGDAAPKDGGTLTLAIAKEPECLDPHQSPTESARLLDRPLVDSLVYQDPQGRLRPWLATKWTVSPDLLTYEFQLREGVTFTDGTKFDSAAVVANLDQIVAPRTKSLLAGSLLAAYDSARAAGPSAVEVKLKRPDSGFLGALATPNLGMESPATLKGDPATLCAKVVGTGPFRSDGGFTPQKGIDYTRNDAYAWPPGGGAPTEAHLARISVRIVPDDASRSGALTSGQVDAVTDLPPNGLRELKGSSGFNVVSTPFPGANFSYWPNTANGPLADVNVRKALRAGVNWGQIVKNVYFGVYKAAQGVLSPSTPGYAASLASAYAYHPAEANKLLDQAGWTTRDSAGYRTKNGVRLKIRHLWSDPSIEPLAVQAQASAKSLGVQFVEERLDAGTYVKRLLAGGYDIIDTSFSAPGPDVLQVLFDKANIPTPQRGISNNIARYDNPAVEAALDQALRAGDQDEQYKIYESVQQQITDDAAVFPIYSPLSTLATRDGVKGVTFTSDGSPDLSHLWLAS
jgi:peptide/nickel transport system substrate-binding protein